MKLVKAPPQATPGYWYELQIFDMLPKQLRDAMNECDTGLPAEGTVLMFVVYKKHGMFSALQWLKDLNDQAREHYNKQMKANVEFGI